MITGDHDMERNGIVPEREMPLEFTGVSVPTVSIVIPSLNASTISQTLAAIAAQSSWEYVLEVLVVGLDAAGLIHAGGKVRLIDTGRPVSAAAARNLGVAAARGDVIAFTDADGVPDGLWLEYLLAAHQAGWQVVGGAISFNAGARYWTCVDNLSMFHEFLPSTAAGIRPYLPTLNLSLTRAAAQAVGPFDESFPGAAGEDIDYTIRLRQRGCPLYFEPRALVHHEPARHSLDRVMGHWWRSGRSMIRVRLRYAGEYHTPWFLRHTWSLRLLAPAIATVVSARILLGRQSIRRNDLGGFLQLPTAVRWQLFPGIWLTKLLWCLGAAQVLAEGDAAAAPDTTETRSIPQARRVGRPASAAALLQPGVIIGILTWNRREDTLACLKSLELLTYPNYHIMVVDNASTDGTAEVVAQAFPQVKIIRNRANLGFATGSNQVAQWALQQGYPYVFFLNNDTLVYPDLLDHLVAVAEAHPDVGLLGPEVRYAAAPSRVWPAAGYRQPLTLEATPVRPVDVAGQAQVDVDYLLGCALLARTDFLRRLGGFDPRYFVYYEDHDLSLRAQAAGYRLLYAPQTYLLHKVQASTGTDSPQHRYLLARSSLLYYLGHTRGWRRCSVAAWRLASAVKQTTRLLVQGRAAAAQAMWRGLREGWTSYKSPLPDDPIRQSKAPVSTTPCPACGTTGGEFYMEGYDRLHSIPGRFDLTRCQACDATFIDPPLQPEQLKPYYPDTYLPFHLHRRSLLARLGWPFGFEMARRCHFVRQLRRGGTLLDIGSANGAFLWAIQKWGSWHVQGVEPDAQAVNVARQVYALENIVQAYLNDVDYAPGTFDMITLWDVLEHLDQPMEQLRRIHRWLKPGGLLLMSIPDGSSWDAKLFRTYWMGWDVPRHLVNYSTHSATLMLERAGFQIMRRAYLTGSHYTFTQSLRFLLDSLPLPERLTNLLTQWTYSRWFRVLFFPYFMISEWAGQASVVTLAARSLQQEEGA
ncbi:MAG: glycosyltransferase [Chloroflexi bacterium]|nr:glycosyltransferase [Chloroflexota bacterium]